MTVYSKKLFDLFNATRMMKCGKKDCVHNYPMENVCFLKEILIDKDGKCTCYRPRRESE